ncbi:MAG: dethiobiotin synthase [Proteobacteria bacterium]|nr:dethiobiotin synthase [Pseudomonadota bacterium]
MSGIFITATGTAIGKTYLTASLLRWDSAHLKCLQASKPIISGWPVDNEEIHHTDTGVLLAAQQLLCTPENINHCSPWRYREPLTPSMAAIKSGQPPLNPANLRIHCEELIRAAKRTSHIHLIEGVGGVMSPLATGFTGIDWLVQVGCPCILVGGSYLGTLSHILTAMVALQSYKIPVLAVVVNETPTSTVPLTETISTLKALLPVSVIPVSYERHPSALAVGLNEVYELILQHF